MSTLGMRFLVQRRQQKDKSGRSQSLITQNYLPGIKKKIRSKSKASAESAKSQPSLNIQSTLSIYLRKKSFLHQQNMNHFPLMNMNKCLCRFIDKILLPCRTDDRPKKSTINWLKVSLLETDIDDPFLFTNFTTLHTLGHTREMWKRQHKKAKQNSVQSTKQNTSMKSKLCCKNSMLRGFICRLRSENSEKTVLALFTFEKFMSLFSSRFPLSKLLLGLLLLLYGTAR